MKTEEHETTKPSTMTIVLGGVMFEAQLRDGSKEEVKVRQLAIELIEEWALLQGDEAALVELYCDRQDKITPKRLADACRLEKRIMEMLDTVDLDKVDEVQARLLAIRNGIAELEKIQRWDAKLVPESHVEIMKIGEDLNHPIFGRWVKDRGIAIGRLTEVRKTMPGQSDSESSSSTAAASSE